jgi:hypothetical protein
MKHFLELILLSLKLVLVIHKMARTLLLSADPVGRKYRRKPRKLE